MTEFGIRQLIGSCGLCHEAETKPYHMYHAYQLSKTKAQIGQGRKLS